MIQRVIPWLSEDNGDTARLRDAAEAVWREQEEIAPAIHAQTERLLEAGRINGFTKQLRLGFRLHASEE